jgi:hypothetical protein
MGESVTPALNRVTKNQISQFRENRAKTNFKGCTQLYQMFIKADGTISCSCMRYWDILADLHDVDISAFFNGPMMSFIRESFANGYEPFSFCEGCPSRLTDFDAKQEYDYIDLHVEPSNQCNLYCEACICTFERLTHNPPSRVSLDYELYEKALCSIHKAGLRLRHLALVGFGEPLFHSRVPDMARLGRALFPNSNIFLDTNGNFGRQRAEEIADCGLNEIRLALDGVDQTSYEAYRRAGDFKRAFQFARDLADAIRLSKSSTRAVWKYILFRHNDSDKQLLAAIRMAGEIGIPIIFDATVGSEASKRPASEIVNLTGQPIGCNIDPQATSGEKLPLGVPERSSSLWRRINRFRTRA